MIFLYASFYIDQSLLAQTQAPPPPPHSPSGASRATCPLLVAGCTRLCGCEDPHMHGIPLALGIIYKGCFLCGTQSPCLLPLQPVTLPGLLLPPRLHTAEFGALPQPVLAATLQRNCLSLFLYILLLKTTYLENPNLSRQKESIHPKVTQPHPIWP